MSEDEEREARAYAEEHAERVADERARESAQETAERLAAEDAMKAAREKYESTFREVYAEHFAEEFRREYERAYGGGAGPSPSRSDRSPLSLREEVRDVATEAGTEGLEGPEAHVLVAELHAVEGGLRDPELPGEVDLGGVAP